MEIEKCIKCGKATEIGLFCTSCYVPNIKIPKKINIKRCKHCLRYFIDNKWQTLSQLELEEQLSKKIKGDIKEAFINIDNKEVIVVIEGKTRDVEYTMPINIEIENVTCPECSKKRGSYYEAIIQLRGERERVQNLAFLIYNKLSKKTFITKTAFLKEGIDIYVGSSKAVLEFLHNAGIKGYKLSKKLHTAKQGKRLYRLTILIRV